MTYMDEAFTVSEPSKNVIPRDNYKHNHRDHSNNHNNWQRKHRHGHSRDDRERDERANGNWDGGKWEQAGRERENYAGDTWRGEGELQRDNRREGNWREDRRENGNWEGNDSWTKDNSWERNDPERDIVQNGNWVGSEEIHEKPGDQDLGRGMQQTIGKDGDDLNVGEIIQPFDNIQSGSLEEHLRTLIITVTANTPTSIVVVQTTVTPLTSIETHTLVPSNTLGSNSGDIKDKKTTMEVHKESSGYVPPTETTFVQSLTNLPTTPTTAVLTSTGTTSSSLSITAKSTNAVDFPETSTNDAAFTNAQPTRSTKPTQEPAEFPKTLYKDTTHTSSRTEKTTWGTIISTSVITSETPQVYAFGLAPPHGGLGGMNPFYNISSSSPPAPNFLDSQTFFIYWVFIIALISVNLY